MTQEQRRKRDAAVVALSILCGIAVFLSFVAGGLALISRFSQTNARRAEQTRVNVAVCRASASERAALRALVIQGDRQLGTPKAAGYVYYHNHPAELAAAHAQTRKNLRVYLPVIKCAPNGVPYKPRTTTQNLGRH